MTRVLVTGGAGFISSNLVRHLLRESDRELPPTTEESTLGALVLLAGRKVAAGEAEQLDELLPEFAEFILAPYLGAERAALMSGDIRPAQP